MAELDDNEVQVGDKKFGFNTVVKMNIKTVLTIVTFLWLVLSTIGTIAYFDLKDKINDNNVKIQQENTLFLEKVSNKIDNVQTDLNTTKLGIETMKGDIKVILDRNSRQPMYEPVTTNRNYAPVKSTKPPSN